MVQAIVFAQNPSKLKNLELLITLPVQLLHLLRLLNNGGVNKIAKVDLIDVLNFASDKLTNYWDSR
jgi:hypothetical protein